MSPPSCWMWIRGCTGWRSWKHWTRAKTLRPSLLSRLLKNIACEHCLGMEVQPEPYMEFWRMVLFVLFAIVSYVYRWVVTFSILFFLSNWLKPYKLESLSMMLAIGALVSLLFWPAYRLVKSVRQRGRLPDMKRKRVVTSGVVLTAILIALSYWRTRRGFLKHAFVTNAFVMASGFLLVGYQLSGYLLA